VAHARSWLRPVGAVRPSLVSSIGAYGTVTPVSERIVIAGGGHAGAAAAEAVRREGFAGPVVLVGAEPHLPYQRPPLSKKFLAGEQTLEGGLVKAPSFYSQHSIEVRTGTRVDAIDVAGRQVRLSDGATLEYGKLLLCLGSEPRRLDVPGESLRGVFYLRTAEEVAAIREQCREGARLVIVGGGYIGLEVAATCRKRGLEVTVLEMADRVMNRVVAPQVSSFYETEHAAHGVRIHCNTGVSAIEGDGSVSAVVSADGRRFPADVVIIGVGVQPVTQLAAAAGIACDNGIVVDEHCRTSAANVFAAGDCTFHPSPRYGRRVRLESVDNAFEQARSAAANAVGRDVVHDKVPWFWSDQFDLKLLIVGLAHGFDRAVVRGDPAARTFSVSYLRQGELIALDAVNHPKDYMAARKLISERARLDPARLCDPTLALKDCV
jgi:3-phenylpropionate/trans-cinnamate dioxygenase ferredoxin reductase subunit